MPPDPNAVRAPVIARPSAESLLLALARDLTARAVALDGSADVEAVGGVLVSAYGAEAPLAIALREDWLRTRDDKTARLALAWAREQLRLALVEVLQRAWSTRATRTEGDVDTLAWLWLAACEALAHEPASAATDRAHAVVGFLKGR